MRVVDRALSQPDARASHRADRDGRHAEGTAAPARAAARQAAAGAAEALPLRHYLKQPRILATGVAFFGYNYVLFFFLSWFPSYLVQAHHLNIREMSVATVVPWLVGTVGLACGGVISDAIYKLTATRCCRAGSCS
ncbi:D-galactarate permease [Burkholderia oklahomensis]|nr:major Facilitator Superfamily protein [Burkholderia oklahomensis C6786]SUY27243.1 D-galactarate permease [Burkholderia oklahomensis]